MKKAVEQVFLENALFEFSLPVLGLKAVYRRRRPGLQSVPDKLL